MMLNNQQTKQKKMVWMKHALEVANNQNLFFLSIPLRKEQNMNFWVPDY